jgi:hypothetical protein
MTLKRRLLSRRKLTASIAAGVAAIGLGIGGFAIASSGSSNSASASGNAAAGKVVPFQRGQPGPSKQVGQVPAGWNAGSGTIVTGAAADKAKAAALAAYPGGTVNRVVLVGNGDYNVHMIGVSWPHHVFVNQSFKVIGAE